MNHRKLIVFLNNTNFNRRVEQEMIALKWVDYLQAERARLTTQLWLLSLQKAKRSFLMLSKAVMKF